MTTYGTRLEGKITGLNAKSIA